MHFKKAKNKSIYLLHSTHVQPFFKVHVFFYANVVTKFMIENNNKKERSSYDINEKLARL